MHSMLLPLDLVPLACHTAKMFGEHHNLEPSCSCRLKLIHNFADMGTGGETRVSDARSYDEVRERSLFDLHVRRRCDFIEIEAVKKLSKQGRVFVFYKIDSQVWTRVRNHKIHARLRCGWGCCRR